MIAPRPITFIANWGSFYASDFWGGMRRFFRESHSWDWSWEFVPTALTCYGMAQSNVGCCASR